MEVVITYHQLRFCGICYLLGVVDRNLFIRAFLLPVFDIAVRFHALLNHPLDEGLPEG